MDRKQKLKINTVSSMTNRLIIMGSGLILPKFILSSYGSEINGLVNSINQFLSIIVFLDLGVGSVVQSALYRPLAEKDYLQISNVLASSKRYFRKIAYSLVIYVILLVIFYPTLTTSNLDYLSTSFLIIALSISLFSQYYFGIVNELLLNADQKSYLQYNIESIVVILNLVLSLILIKQGFSIQIVKLVSGMIYLIRPVFLAFYVSRHYWVNSNVEIKQEPLAQKWNGMAQHIAFSIQNSSDIVILSIFSDLKLVSIYSVYNLVVQGIKLIVESFSASLKSYFGNILVTENHKSLLRLFAEMEWITHNLIVFLYGMTIILISPFVKLYTEGVTDVNYYQPLFALLLIISQILYSLRIPYQALIFSAGHFKQTQLSSIIEVSINLALSIFFVIQYGLIGVTIGTIFAMVYRLSYLIYYLMNNILYRSLNSFIKLVSTDLISLSLIIVFANQMISDITIVSIFDWFIAAIYLSIMTLSIIFIVNLIFYNNRVKSLLAKKIKK